MPLGNHFCASVELTLRIFTFRMRNKPAHFKDIVYKTPLVFIGTLNLSRLLVTVDGVRIGNWIY
jgi:hypothetical protein